MPIKNLFFEFIQSPDRDTYLAIRKAVLSSDDYDPYSDEMQTVGELLEDGRPDEAFQALAAAMPNLLLSPRAHLALAHIAEESGQGEKAKMEEFFAVSCCEGILATGAGTRENPFLVVRTSDEHDLLQYLEKTFTGQSLQEIDGRHFDVITCSDGSKLWFDISDTYAQLEKRFGDPPE
ncbi:MAG: DUF4919 domain-containing protein [Pirellulaceae bacterium]